MALPELVPSGQPVDVQKTSFSLDVLGRFICSTWQEATGSGGPPFSAVVIGGGMYGAYCATKIYRRHPGKRVLLLDAGPFLVSEHVQNLGPIGLNVPAPISPNADPRVPRELVWGLPWRGNVDFPGLAYCTGGKSLYWGGWCPRLTASDLGRWPASTAAYLEGNYLEVESEIGVVPATDFIAGELCTTLSEAFASAASVTPGFETGIGDRGVEVAPLAVQGDSPVSGLFSFDKYSSLPMLMDAVREDVAASGGRDADRRLFVVPLAHVIRAHTADGAVTRIDVDAAGQPESLQVSPDCAVILAASAVETTRLALCSFPTPLMGRNLMAHVRSDFTVRIRRTALPPVPDHVQTGALLLRGLAPAGRFHIQVTASTSQGGSDELLFRMLPDIDLLDRQLANTDPEWITVTLRCIGEMQGDRTTVIPDPDKSWINLSPHEVDEYGIPRAYLHITLDPRDEQVWQAMDTAALAIARAVAGSPDQIQYLYDNAWHAAPFPLDRPFPEWHRGLGTTYHESGTLWMGDDPATSVTDPIGRFHHVRNAYACDQSLFPTVGSVNPVLTGLTLARQLAERI
ncbi:GMC oxidoreductase [Nonomuraea guangzhouensis]|uniref:GMC oxidoreductase n=1 Tax=Nonomuraea guangzhouensis TaxID=1291555 RepID=A0ABW4GQ38_9ACTN|nr:GMC oxidoreductase [Nonomuraea guangzhouensis]